MAREVHGLERTTNQSREPEKRQSLAPGNGARCSNNKLAPKTTGGEVPVRALGTVVDDPVTAFLQNLESNKDLCITWTGLRTFPAPVRVGIRLLLGGLAQARRPHVNDAKAPLLHRLNPTETIGARQGTIVITMIVVGPTEGGSGSVGARRFQVDKAVKALLPPHHLNDVRTRGALLSVVDPKGVVAVQKRQPFAVGLNHIRVTRGDFASCNHGAAVCGERLL